MMVGRSLTNYYTRTYNNIGAEVLKVRNITQKGVFKDISFNVHAGEILGFAGLIGAGRSEVMQAIFGSRKIDSGDVFLNGKKTNYHSCADAIKDKVSMVPEDRKLQGLILKNSVGFNITLANLKAIISGISFNEKKKNALIDKYINKLRIKTPSQDTLVSNLSGGNQQKVVLAKWLSTQPQLLILDEPTRGVDVGAKSEIYSIINDAAKNGMAVIMVSSDLPEIINMCDNVCVMHEGRLTGKLSRENLNQESIMKYATGDQL
jgi:ribose transport system ATP-binding protein